MTANIIPLASRNERVRKWRELAGQALVDMDRSLDPDAKAIFQSIASEYTALADMAEAGRLNDFSCAPQAALRKE